MAHTRYRGCWSPQPPSTTRRTAPAKSHSPLALLEEKRLGGLRLLEEKPLGRLRPGRRPAHGGGGSMLSGEERYPQTWPEPWPIVPARHAACLQATRDAASVRGAGERILTMECSAFGA